MSLMASLMIAEAGDAHTPTIHQVKMTKTVTTPYNMVYQLLSATSSRVKHELIGVAYPAIEFHEYFFRKK